MIQKVILSDPWTHKGDNSGIEDGITNSTLAFFANTPWRFAFALQTVSILPSLRFGSIASMTSIVMNPPNQPAII